jgi:predicted transcriptional regulator
MRLPFFRLRGFTRLGEIIAASLGKLEIEVMEYVWARGETRVRDVHSLLEGRVAYTTLMTTLDRLHKKGLLDRRKENRAFVYSPRLTRHQISQGIARDLIDGMLARENGQTEPVLACLIDAVSDHDRALLDDLERMIQKKRRALPRKP